MVDLWRGDTRIAAAPIPPPPAARPAAAGGRRRRAARKGPPGDGSGPAADPLDLVRSDPAGGQDVREHPGGPGGLRPGRGALGPGRPAWDYGIRNTCKPERRS